MIDLIEADFINMVLAFLIAEGLLLLIVLALMTAASKADDALLGDRQYEEDKPQASATGCKSKAIR